MDTIDQYIEEYYLQVIYRKLIRYSAGKMGNILNKSIQKHNSLAQHPGNTISYEREKGKQAKQHSAYQDDAG